MAGQTQDALWRWQHSQVENPPLLLDPVDFLEIPGWLEDDHFAALECYSRSAPLAEPPLPASPLVHFSDVISAGAAARSFFEKNFEPHRVRAEGGLLTSYFEPVLKGSRRRSSTFCIPVYRRPPELEVLPSEHALMKIGLTAGRSFLGALVPYYTRAEIQSGALEGRGLELLYLADPIQAFIMHVQGSGRVELDDGTNVRLSFDGKNGHPYTSISKLLIERSHLAWEDAHLEGMICALQDMPERDLLLTENKSYVFFKELAASDTGPSGSMGTSLFPGRSLAADPLFHQLGIPIWIAAPSLSYEGTPFQRLTVVQDTGSAIKGAKRGDIFAGLGEDAGRVAGRIRHECDFIVLRPSR